MANGEEVLCQPLLLLCLPTKPKHLAPHFIFQIWMWRSRRFRVCVLHGPGWGACLALPALLGTSALGQHPPGRCVGIIFPPLHFTACSQGPRGGSIARTDPEIDSGPEFSLCIDLPSLTFKVIFTFSPLASHVWSSMFLATQSVYDIWEIRIATSPAVNSRTVLSD